MQTIVYPIPNGFQPKKPMNDNKDLVNERIRFPEVMVIGADGKQYGVMSRQKALQLSLETDLDLLCVAPQAKPPVCKLINYSKYRYEAQKKQKEAKKNQHVIEIKEIQLTPQIGQHDLETKAKAAVKFLQEGNKLKVGVRFRGRQMTHIEVGQQVMNNFISLIDEYATVESQPAMDGRWLNATFASKVKK